MNNTFFIDIRKSDEVYGLRFHESVPHVCVPSNMIRFNITYLKELVKSKPNAKIYLVCNSGNRSKFIYNKYFSNDKTLKSIKVSKNIQFKNFEVADSTKAGIFNNIPHYVLIGKNTTLIKKELGFKPIFSYNGYNYYSLTRVLQTILGSLLILTALLLWSKCYKNHKWVLWVALIMGINALINGLTSTCTISKVFMNYLN
jgi:rhodanese-related sulfurtransferase